MDEMERIQKMIEQQKEILQKFEAKWNEIPEKSLDSQSIALQLLKAELSELEQKLTS